jgi:hypothetical protein
MEPIKVPSVIERIRADKGEAWIETKYHEAVAAARTFPTIPFQIFRDFVYPDLLKHSIGEPDDNLDCTDLFVQWLSLSHELEDCRLHTGLCIQDYPQVSTRLTTGETVKLQLHQVPFFMECGWTSAAFDFAVDKVFAHCCHNRSCLVHAWPMSREQNNYQTYCKRIQLVDNTLHIVCRCEPRHCLQPGSLAFPF